MAGFPYLSRIADKGTQEAVQKMWEEINTLRAQVQVLQAQALTASSLNAQGNRFQNIGDAQADTDAVNLRTLRNFAQAQTESF